MKKSDYIWIRVSRTLLLGKRLFRLDKSIQGWVVGVSRSGIRAMGSDVTKEVGVVLTLKYGLGGCSCLALGDWG